MALMSTRILIAEDQPDLREMIAATLRLSGYEVVSAADGQQAFTSAQSSRPDLIILDLEMPHMSGSEVCRRLKAMPPFHGTPVLIISSTNDLARLEDSLNAGAREYMRKPFELDQLISRVGVLLAEN